MKKYTITKVLNHNIVFATHETTDYILIGKGIGFQKKPGHLVIGGDVSSSYIVYDIEKVTQYENVVLSTQEDVVFSTEKAIQYAESELDHVFKESIHISLLDHINFSIYRMNNNLHVGSFLTKEYYLLYPKLYEISKAMVNIINDSLDVNLPESEIGAIILHLHAAIHEEEMSTLVLYTEIIDFSLNFIEERLVTINPNNEINKARLITHLKFALKRHELNQNLQNLMVDTIKEKYPTSFKIAKDLFNKLKALYAINFDDSEIAYIAMHIENLK